MSKKKFKLDLNKQVISNLQAKQIIGGGTHETDYNGHYCRIYFKTDERVCNSMWSEGTDDLHNME